MSNNKTGLQIIREWAEESKTGEIQHGFIIASKGLAIYVDTLTNKITEIEKELQSRPVGDVEGYLEDMSEWPEPYPIKGQSPMILMYKMDAIAALQALKANCDREKDGIREDRDNLVLLLNDAIENRNSLTDKLEDKEDVITDLTAEVERLRGENPILELRDTLIEMMHKNPHITPYDVVKMIDKIYPQSKLPNPQP